ncbi:Cys-tRNA(Pro) deacylase [Clostridiales bacterium]|nr:Cys-tRNA(Pro) deacylase [Clostridiales bacterium]
MKKEEKTNVMRVLEQKKIAYQSHSYEPDATMTGLQIAVLLGQEPSHVFKTLVTVGKPARYYVFVIPVESELDLKKAAAAAGEKSVSMIPQKELLPLTGYIHGGCSPIGMKKHFPTFIHQSAGELPAMCVSAGKVGFQIELCPSDLLRAADAKLADLV